MLGGLAASGGVATTILRPNSYTFPNGNGVGDVPPDRWGRTPVHTDSCSTKWRHRSRWPGARRPGAPNRWRASIKRSSAQACCAFWLNRTSPRSPESALWRAANSRSRSMRRQRPDRRVQAPFGVGPASRRSCSRRPHLAQAVNRSQRAFPEGAVSTGDTSFTNADGPPGRSAATIPALQVRRAETTVEIPSAAPDDGRPHPGAHASSALEGAGRDEHCRLSARCSGRATSSTTKPNQSSW